jgi:hypothetical protein
MTNPVAAASLGNSQKQALSLSQAAPGSDWRRFDGPVGPAAAAASRSRSFSLLPALILAVLAFFAVSALETFSINSDRPAAILFPAAMSKEQAFAAVVAAGGLPVRPGRSVLSDGIVWIAAAGAPDFFDKVKSYGAWAVINPFAFGGCFLVKPI